MLAVDTYRTNAALLRAAWRLGYLPDDGIILDVTYGRGTWWRGWENDRHFRLVVSDLDRTTEAHYHWDFTDLPDRLDGYFDAVAFDPPYKLHGTSTAKGQYGLNEYMPMGERHKMMVDGLLNCLRLTRPGGFVLAKCQDQVCEGRMNWQTFMLTERAFLAGAPLVERLDMAGTGRPQPARTRIVCLHCHKQVGKTHACRKVLNSADDYPPPEDWPILDDLPPWLRREPSPQLHAYHRPSSLLIFRKDTE